MCLILDINVFRPFFCQDSPGHPDFEPVRDWVFRGEGKLVYGGSKYKAELRRCKKYLGLLKELSRRGKVVAVDDEEVDRCQDIVSKIDDHEDFDDPHLVAIVKVSKCRIVCTQDSRAIPFLKDARFYSEPGEKRPVIYSSRRNKDLLSTRNIADVCKPCKRLRKEESDALLGRLAV